MSGSQVNQIVDYSASLAAGIPGIKAVFGSGSSGINDPLRPGQPIRSAIENPAQEFEHWSELPNAPIVVNVTQSGTVELTWTIPMRLWLQRADLAHMRKVALPFYNGYLAAFVNDQTLGGLALISNIGQFAIGEDGPPAPGQTSWGWLDVHLQVTEMVNF